MSFKERGEQFLNDNRRIAVFGVSREGGASPGNAIYKALKDRGYEVYAINPKADEVEGDVCYHDVRDVPGGNVQGAILSTPAGAAEAIVKDCYAAGIQNVWMHYNPMFGKGNASVSDEAVEFCHENGMNVIDGGCPMMFFDVPHKCMRVMLGAFGKLPA
jgi:predicted CoA-binding protein